MRSTAVLALCLPLVAFAQEPIDAQANARIRHEALEAGQVMTTLHGLVDYHGGRLTASPAFQEAAAWAQARLKAWGVQDVRLEPWAFGHPGWSQERCAAQVLAPFNRTLGVEVLAWTPSTPGPVKGEVLALALPQDPTGPELAAALAPYADRVAGRMVLVGPPKAVAVLPEPAPPRMDAETLRRRFDPAAPAPPARFPDRNAVKRPGALTSQELNRQVDAFLLAHKALARVNDAGMRNGMMRTFNNRTFDLTLAPPTVVMRADDFGRLWRIQADGKAPVLALDIVNRTHPDLTKGTNVLGELRGAERPQEVILLGAHLDAWHTATGATDDGAGCAVMMEAVRILASLKTPLKRTVRIALWDGEELGLLGSQAHVKARYGSFEAKGPEWDQLVAYVNMDSGAGAIRGLSVFGPDGAVKAIREILKPFEDLGVAGASQGRGRLRKPDYADITSFSSAGLTTLGVVQDGLEYFDYTWHTTIDTFERCPPQDLQRTAAVIASLALHLANRDERLPAFTEKDMPPFVTPGEPAPKAR